MNASRNAANRVAGSAASGTAGSAGAVRLGAIPARWAMSPAIPRRIGPTVQPARMSSGTETANRVPVASHVVGMIAI